MKPTLPLLALVTLASTTPLPASTPPSSFKITNVISGGTGCPQGSIDVTWTDNAVLPISFGPTFTATVGPNTSVTDARKNCQLNLALSYTPGYAFAVYSAEYAGVVALERGVSGVLKTNYYFSGETDQTSTKADFVGPTKSRFSKRDDVALAVWSPCGGEALLNVNTEVALSPLNSPASGFLGVSKESGRLASSLYVGWKKC